jgi:hypothetical protein
VIGSGNDATAAFALERETVPIEPVGQATRAISARCVSSGVTGWRATNENPSPCA